VQFPETLILPGGQVVTLAPDSDSAWEIFAGAVSGEDCPIYHWSRFDAGVLRSTGPTEVRQALESRMHDLHATFKRTVSLPLKSTSIKVVSTYLGYPWPGYNAWFAAWADYAYWLDSDDREALARACMYQRADVQSLAWVWRWLVEGESH
jgi:predicted RecB family nuclease